MTLFLDPPPIEITDFLREYPSTPFVVEFAPDGAPILVSRDAALLAFVSERAGWASYDVIAGNLVHDRWRLYVYPCLQKKRMVEAL